MWVRVGRWRGQVRQQAVDEAEDLEMDCQGFGVVEFGGDGGGGPNLSHWRSHHQDPTPPPPHLTNQILEKQRWSY